MQRIWIVQWVDCEGMTQQNLFNNREGAEACYSRLASDDFADEDFQYLEVFWQGVLTGDVWIESDSDDIKEYQRATAL
jgi:hypothetical protein